MAKFPDAISIQVNVKFKAKVSFWKCIKFWLLRVDEEKILEKIEIIQVDPKICK